MIVLDSIYYICCLFYKNREKETFKGSGLILMVGSVLMNVMLIVVLLHSSMTKYAIIEFMIKSRLNQLLIAFGISLIIGMPLYIRYFRHMPFEKIDQIILALSKTKKIILSMIAIIYLIYSYFFIISYGIYLGINK